MPLPKTLHTRLRQQIAQGKTRQVIEDLCSVTVGDHDLNADALALSARYQNFLREKNGGRMDASRLDTELNKINAAALHMIELLPDVNGRVGSNLKKNAIIAASIVASLGAIAEFSGWSLRDLFQSSSVPPATVQQQPEPLSPINISTSGANSPAINAPDGKLEINYGDLAPDKPTVQKDSLITK